MGANLQEGLVSVSPEEVLCAEVLVRVLSALLKWLHVGPVLPVLVPENVGVGGSNDQCWDNSAKNGQHLSLHLISISYPLIGIIQPPRLLTLSIPLCGSCRIRIPGGVRGLHTRWRACATNLFPS